jgi:hypothetical protein
MNRPVEITPAVLRDLISYDPETGDMVWKERPAKFFIGAKRDGDWSAKQWNSRLAGKPALASVAATGCLNGSVFAQPLLAHRVAWAIYHGEWPKNEIDHINGNRADNRIVNLRDVPRSLNVKNCKRRKDNTSGFAGVYRYKNRYLAHLRINGKLKIVARCDTPEEAFAIREQEKLKYGFHPNHGRD